jgi:hypothetical protein
VETLTSGSVRAWGCNSPGPLDLRERLTVDSRASSLLMEWPGDSSEATFVIPFRR